MKLSHTLVLTLFSVLGLTLPGSASVIVNGDFEDWPGATPSGWTLVQGSNPAKQTGPNAIGGAGNSALFSSSGRLAQTFTALGGVPSRFELDFAAEDLSGQSDPHNLRSVNLGLFYNASLGGPRVHLRMNGVGDVQRYATDGWVTIDGLAGAVSLDADVTTSPAVNRLAVTSFGQLPLPLYQVQVTDTDDTLHQSGLLRRHEGGAPGAGAAWEAVQFRSDLSQGDYLVDNATLSELPWIPSLSVPAQYVATANQNPGDQGWSLTRSNHPAENRGYESNDAGTGIDAWRIENAAGMRAFYRKDIETTAANLAMDRGWRLDTVLRITDEDRAPNNSRYVSFVGPGDSTTGKEFGLNFGSDADGNAIVEFRDGTGTHNLGAGGYHLFSMVYDPLTELASLFIDGGDTPVLSDYGGFAKASAFGTDTFLRFGAISTGAVGSANYHLVQFSVIPEPGTLVLLAIAAGALLALRPRRR